MPPLFCYSICHHHCPAKHLHPLLRRQHANRRLWTQALCSEASRAPMLPCPCSHLPPPVPSCTSCQCHQPLLRFLILLNWFWSQSEHQQAWPCRSRCVHQIRLGLGIFPERRTPKSFLFVPNDSPAKSQADWTVLVQEKSNLHPELVGAGDSQGSLQTAFLASQPLCQLGIPQASSNPRKGIGPWVHM